MSARGRVVLVLAAVIVAGGAAAATTLPEDLEDLLWDVQVIPLEDDPLPPFRLESIDGRWVSSGDLRGRAALLYFWDST